MPRPKTRTDAEVLDAAGRALARLGPHQLTLADVAKEAGLSPATLIQRFGTRRGLLVAFARRAAESAQAPFEEARRAHRSPLAALRQALLTLAEDSSDREAIANGLAFLIEDLRDEELRAAAAAHAAAIEREIIALVEAAAAKGELRSPAPQAFARALYAAWNGALIQWSLRGDGPLDQWLSATLDVLLRPGSD